MNDLVEQLSEYNKFKYYVNKMIGYLNSAILDLETPKDQVEENFSIDDSRADDNNLNNIYDDLVIQRDFLVNTCIPSINDKINELKKAIEQGVAII